MGEWRNWTLVLTIPIPIPSKKQIRMPVRRISHHSLDSSTWMDGATYQSGREWDDNDDQNISPRKSDSLESET